MWMIKRWFTKIQIQGGKNSKGHKWERILKCQPAKFTNWIKWAKEKKDADNKVSVTRRIPLECYLRERYMKGEMGVESLHYTTKLPPGSDTSCIIKSSIFFLGLHVPQSPCTFYTSHLTSSWNSLACGLMHLRKSKLQPFGVDSGKMWATEEREDFPVKKKRPTEAISTTSTTDGVADSGWKRNMWLVILY